MSVPSTSLLVHENARLILEEAWRLFQRKGYRGVSIDELCIRCGLTKPTLYYYFKDKETLFVEVLQYRLRGLHAVIEEPGNITERLERAAASILDHFSTSYHVLLRDREHIHNEENQLLVRDAFHQELFGPLEDLMQQGIQSGELRGDAGSLVLIFLGIINNFIGRSDGTSLAKELTGYFIKGAKFYE
jgi:AcrR family transcriptional regulator